jgi:hypothetical protein
MERPTAAPPQANEAGGPRLRIDPPTLGDAADDSNDFGCFATLSEYTNASCLGSGGYGVVLEVYHPVSGAIPLVIKLMSRTDEARREIDKALRVSTRLPALTNGIFSRVYGWIACGPVFDPRWVRALPAPTKEFDPRKEPLYYLVSEHANGFPLARYVFPDLRACKEFFFELFHALAVAYTKFKYHHNDLHMGNVIVSKVIPTRREYVLPPGAGGGPVFAIESSVRPTIIDYGFNTFGEAEEAADALAYADARNLPRTNAHVQYLRVLAGSENRELAAVTMQDRTGPMRDVFKILMSFIVYRRHENTKILGWLRQTYYQTAEMGNFQALLSSHLFADLASAVPAVPEGQAAEPEPPGPGARAERITREKIKRARLLEASLCHVCGRVASQMYEHAPSYRFCAQESCARAMGPIGALLQ